MPHNHGKQSRTKCDFHLQCFRLLWGKVPTCPADARMRRSVMGGGALCVLYAKPSQPSLGPGTIVSNKQELSTQQLYVITIFGLWFLLPQFHPDPPNLPPTQIHILPCFLSLENK